MDPDIFLPGVRYYSVYLFVVVLGHSYSHKETTVKSNSRIEVCVVLRIFLLVLIGVCWFQEAGKRIGWCELWLIRFWLNMTSCYHLTTHIVKILILLFFVAGWSSTQVHPIHLYPSQETPGGKRWTWCTGVNWSPAPNPCRGHPATDISFQGHHSAFQSVPLVSSTVSTVAALALCILILIWL